MLKAPKAFYFSSRILGYDANRKSIIKFYRDLFFIRWWIMMPMSKSQLEQRQQLREVLEWTGVQTMLCMSKRRTEKPQDLQFEIQISNDHNKKSWAELRILLKLFFFILLIWIVVVPAKCCFVVVCFDFICPSASSSDFRLGTGSQTKLCKFDWISWLHYIWIWISPHIR